MHTVDHNHWNAKEMTIISFNHYVYLHWLQSSRNHVVNESTTTTKIECPKQKIRCNLQLELFVWQMIHSNCFCFYFFFFIDFDYKRFCWLRKKNNKYYIDNEFFISMMLVTSIEFSQFPLNFFSEFVQIRFPILWSWIEYQIYQFHFVAFVCNKTSAFFFILQKIKIKTQNCWWQWNDKKKKPR